MATENDLKTTRLAPVDKQNKKKSLPTNEIKVDQKHSVFRAA